MKIESCVPVVCHEREAWAIKGSGAHNSVYSGVWRIGWLLPGRQAPCIPTLLGPGAVGTSTVGMEGMGRLGSRV